MKKSFYYSLLCSAALVISATAAQAGTCGIMKTTITEIAPGKLQSDWARVRYEGLKKTKTVSQTTSVLTSPARTETYTETLPVNAPYGTGALQIDYNSSYDRKIDVDPVTGDERHYFINSTYLGLPINYYQSHFNRETGRYEDLVNVTKTRTVPAQYSTQTKTGADHDDQWVQSKVYEMKAGVKYPTKSTDPLYDEIFKDIMDQANAMAKWYPEVAGDCTMYRAATTVKLLPPQKVETSIDASSNSALNFVTGNITQKLPGYFDSSTTVPTHACEVLYLPPEAVPNDASLRHISYSARCVSASLSGKNFVGNPTAKAEIKYKGEISVSSSKLRAFDFAPDIKSQIKTFLGSQNWSTTVRDDRFTFKQINKL